MPEPYSPNGDATLKPKPWSQLPHPESGPAVQGLRRLGFEGLVFGPSGLKMRALKALGFY